MTSTALLIHMPTQEISGAWRARLRYPSVSYGMYFAKSPSFGAACNPYAERQGLLSNRTYA